MKRILLILTLAIFSCHNNDQQSKGLSIPLRLSGNVYYFSATGSDGNSGTSSASPWQTIGKFNSFGFGSGDSISFKSGETFFGGMIPKNGVHIGSYSTGNKPIITGFSTISAWTSIGGGLYTASVPGGLSTLGVVEFDNNFQPMGRMPKGNISYYNVNSGTTSSITSTGTTGNNPNSFASAPNCVGGEVVYRPYHWVFWRATITSQTTTSVNFTAFPSTSGGGVYSATQNGANYGFFLQNHPKCCTQLGEWAYTAGSHTITMFFGGAGPAGHTVKVSSVDNMVTSAGTSNVFMSGIRIEGANTYLVSLNGSSGWNFNNCELWGSGLHGIFANGNSTGLTYTNGLIQWCNSIGIRYSSGSTGTIISGNTFRDIGAVAGMGGSGEGQYFGIQDAKVSCTITLNKFQNIGYCPFSFQGTNNVVSKNFVDSFCTVKDDGGGIYAGAQSYSGTVISNNIVLHGIGVPTGTPDNEHRAEAFYMDDGGSNCTYLNNTGAFCGDAGFFNHSASSLTLTGNTFFDNATGQIRYFNDCSTGTCTGSINQSGNIFFCRTSSEYCFKSSGGSASVLSFFSSADNNYFCRPTAETQVFNVAVGTGAGSYTLAGWKTFTGKETNSHVSPMTTTNIGDIRFEYNATNSPSVISLSGNTYLDVTGTAHSGTITLAAFTSVVLIKTAGTGNILPVSNAGSDQTITLPLDSALVTGSGTDADGTISSVQWAQVGTTPSTATIVSVTSNTTRIRGLGTSGTYQFKFTVTDNSGGTATDFVNIVVLPPAANIPPTANAGADQSTTATSVTVTGTASDADGSIDHTLWQQLTGPNTATITASGSLSTTITGLVVGTYQFKFTSFDNLGAFTSDNITIVVNPVADIPPVTSAGSDINLVLPLDSTLITGTASDPDGSVSSSGWTLLSGPNTPTITVISSLQIKVKGVIAGTYSFRFTATDNLGANTSDLMTLTVSPQPPPSQSFKFFKFIYVQIQTGDSLYWSVDNINNVKQFSLEQSSDGSSFTTVGPAPLLSKYFVQFSSTQTCKKKFWWWCVQYQTTYTVTHYYYRIKGVDLNGNVIYSSVIKS